MNRPADRPLWERAGRWVNRNHLARTAVYTVGSFIILMVTRAIVDPTVPMSLVWTGVGAFGGTILLGGPSLSRFGLSEPKDHPPVD